MSQKVSIQKAYEELLFYGQPLDESAWTLDESILKNSFDPNVSVNAQIIYDLILNKFNEIKPTLPSEVSSQSQHFENKLNHFKQKLNYFESKLVTHEPAGITISHQQFINSIPAASKSAKVGDQLQLKEESPRIYKPLSFQIEDLDKGQPALTPLQILDRISFLFRNGKDQQALQEFSVLPSSIQLAIYEALWMVREKPVGNNPIAHSNFGEVSLKDKEARCSSTPQQKACAVELAKIPATLLEISSAFENKNQALANQIFNTLPSKIQNEIFGKHWVEMGRPTDQSPDESLRRISHPDFGKVSLLGLDPRCDVPLDKKAMVIRAFLSDYKKKIDALQDIIAKKLVDWKDIDNSPIRGPQKNSAKKEALDNLANHFVPQFLDRVVATRPNSKGDSFQSLAEAYINTYPCLRPFFLQLVPNLTSDNEAFIQGPLPTLKKSSQVTHPQFERLEEKDRRAQLIAIMNETLETLQNGFYVNSKGQKVTLNLQPAVISLCSQPTSVGMIIRQGKYNTQIFLDNKDCLSVIRDCINRGLNPIGLDAASEDHFGGGYKTGARAQEENISRRSGLSIAVDPTQGTQPLNFYPLTKEGSPKCLYVSNVPVFRGEEQEGYPYLDQPFETAFAITAAHNFNEEHLKRNSAQKGLAFDKQTGELRIPSKEADETKQKLRTVFDMAQKNGHNSIVLVAFGCGAFQNPPKHMCEIIMELITEEFPHSFKEIHISIIDDQNTGRAHNPRGNYVVFKETIENQFQSPGTIDKIGARFTIT